MDDRPDLLFLAAIRVCGLAHESVGTVMATQGALPTAPSVAVENERFAE